MNPIIIGAILVSLGSVFFWNEKRKISTAATSAEKFTAYDGLFKYYAKIYGFPWRWAKAIAMQESSLGENSRVKNGEVSYDGLSYGIMQIALGTGSPKERELKTMFGLPDKKLTEMTSFEKNKARKILNDPDKSINIASNLIGYLASKYNMDKEKVFLAYNQGEANTDRGKNYTHPNGQYAKIVSDNLTKIYQREKEYKL